MNTVPDWMPTHYTGWRECITVHCGIPLTPDYVAERLKILSWTEPLRGENGCLRS
ncbi:MAG: hypothetical protein LUO80_12375 [Methylococcaceae bacterium]|nr:hypothetical protein [Methylococcaceae bacterium]